MTENKDYELIPGDNDFWNVRILTGDYVETVFKFDRLWLANDDTLHFDYQIVSSPIADLKEDNQDFLRTVQKVLSVILSNI